MSEVLLENLTKTYANDVVAVDQLNLHVHHGELLTVVGPSGCGKTTTLRLIAGLDRPTAGTVHIGGRDMADVSAARRNVAMVFQNAALYPHLRVAGNLAFALRLRKLPRADVDRRVGEVADLLGLADLLRRRPQELSGGQQCRVALGRALAVPADCYLLDEPLSHLDAPARRELRQTIRRLHERLGRTMIYVTHDQDEAMATGDRMAVLLDSRLQQCGPPQQVYRFPANRFVARLIGPSPMNLLPGRLTRHEGRMAFQHEAARFALPASIARSLPHGTSDQVVLGIRPEAIRAAGSAADQDLVLSLPATIETIETLGDRVTLQLNGPGETRLVASMTADANLLAGQQQVFAVNPTDLHFFAGDAAGDNLLVNNEGTLNAG